jgi:hypothetical protein
LNREVVPILGILLYKVFIEMSESQSVPLFMLPILTCIHLQALVSQVHCVVLGRSVVIHGGSAQVSLFVKIHFEIIGQQAPHSDVKFAGFIKQRPFNILLNDPK